MRERERGGGGRERGEGGGEGEGRRDERWRKLAEGKKRERQDTR